MGSDYLSGIEYAICKGIIGPNVNVRIYVDTDQNVDKINKNDMLLMLFGNIFNSLLSLIYGIIDPISHIILNLSKSFISSIRYRIRCPICGDSQKDFKDSHCYIKCSDDPNEPLLYKCFLCNAKGMVNEDFLKMLQIKGDDIPYNFKSIEVFYI